MLTRRRVVIGVAVVALVVTTLLAAARAKTISAHAACSPNANLEQPLFAFDRYRQIAVRMFPPAIRCEYVRLPAVSGVADRETAWHQEVAFYPPVAIGVGFVAWNLTRRRAGRLPAGASPDAA